MTAAAIRRDLLEPALDARAHNVEQVRLLMNPSIEVDSAAEHFALAARHCTAAGRRHIIAGLELIRDALASNALEGDLERRIAGAADTLARDAHRDEHHPQSAQPWSIKRVAKTLRAPLTDLCNPIIQGAGRDQALADVHDVFQRAPQHAVLNVAVRHELGVRKYTKLVELHQAWAEGACS
jgi:hypothetical protein